MTDYTDNKHCNNTTTDKSKTTEESRKYMFEETWKYY